MPLPVSNLRSSWARLGMTRFVVYPQSLYVSCEWRQITVWKTQVPSLLPKFEKLKYLLYYKKKKIEIEKEQSPSSEALKVNFFFLFYKRKANKESGTSGNAFCLWKQVGGFNQECPSPALSLVWCLKANFRPIRKDTSAWPDVILPSETWD